MNYTIQKIAADLFKIKHWEIRSGSYEDISNEKATWFIDPPYMFGGHAYKCSNKKIDFQQLAEWCKARDGHVIVCENMKADWLPFVPFKIQNVLTGAHAEAIWTNYHTHFNNVQQTLSL